MYKKPWMMFCFGLAISQSLAWADAAFVIGKIEPHGLNRVSQETFLTYLPVHVGDEYTDATGDAILHALYQTGFFEDIRLTRKGTTLDVTVTERAVIGHLDFEGHHQLKYKDMVDALKAVGVTEGRTYSPLMDTKIAQELERLYFAEGRYAVDVRTSTTPLPDGRVKLLVHIEEGQVAKIRDIQFVGNQRYSDSRLLGRWSLSTPNLLSWFTKNDRYSKQRLEADIEGLRAFYLDRGFLNFRVRSAQVALTSDKSNVYLTVNVDEGQRYRIESMKIAGNTEEVPLGKLMAALQYRFGEVFSRQRITDVVQELTKVMGDAGYVYATVVPEPVVDEEKRALSLVFHIEAGQRYRVRRVIFTGNERTHDVILRQEMVQWEGDWLSVSKMEESKDRLSRTGYIDDVQIEIKAVDGARDEVDLIVAVEEASAASFNAGVGYSHPDGLLFDASFSHRNFLGLGRFIDVDFNRSDAQVNYNVSYQNPYYGYNGLSRGFNLYYAETSIGDVSSVTDYVLDSAGGNVNYGFPLSEYQNLNASLGYRNTRLYVGANNISQQIQSFLDDHDNRRIYNEAHAQISWRMNSLNRYIFATSGMKHSLELSFAVPKSHLQYYRLHASAQWLKLLSPDVLFLTRGGLGYGNGYGKDRHLPFFKNFFMGGSRSLRGYSENSLGPKDSLGNPFGGNFMVNGSMMVAFPTVLGEQSKQMRPGIFWDFGQVYQVNRSLHNDNSDGIVNSMGLRHSVGVSLTWLTPLGLLEFSWAQPIGQKAGDEIENFTFSIGTSFY